MRPLVTSTYLMLHTCCVSLVVLEARKSSQPYLGFYNPFPPRNDQILYNFASSPPSMSQVDETNPLRQNDTSSSRHHIVHTTYSRLPRETRDSSLSGGGGWEQFDSLMRGDAEPSCNDLRKMWKLAKRLHNERIGGGGASKSATVTRDVKGAEGGLQPSEVYGIVRNFVPTTTASPTTTSTSRPSGRRRHGPVRVRDPAKEILNLLSQRSALRRRRQRLRNAHKQQQQRHLLSQNPNSTPKLEVTYGTVRHEAPSNSNSSPTTKDKPEEISYGKVNHEAPPSPQVHQQKASYLDQVKHRLYGKPSSTSSDSTSSYGVVRTHSGGLRSSSAFDRLRAMVSKDRLASGPGQPQMRPGHAFLKVKSAMASGRRGRRHQATPRMSSLMSGNSKSFRSKHIKDNSNVDTMDLFQNGLVAKLRRPRSINFEEQRKHSHHRKKGTSLKKSRSGRGRHRFTHHKSRRQKGFIP